MKTFLTIVSFLIFSENVLFGQINITLTPTNVTCFGSCNGAINTTVTGGTPGYTFNWNNFATTQNLTNLCSGTYIVTVMDAASVTATQIVTITQPLAITAAITAQTNVFCNGLCKGSATVTAGGGTPGYTYLWNTVPSQNTSTVNNLCDEIYSVTVTDTHDCTVTTTTVLLQPTTALISTIISQDVSCFGSNDGILSANTTGGIPPYTYLWSNSQTTPVVTNLSAGTYSVTVNADNGCTATSSNSISQPNAIIITDSVMVSQYNDANINLTVSGGLLPYSYTWSNGANTEDITVFSSGLYVVTVTDINYCTIIDSISVNISHGISNPFLESDIRLFNIYPNPVSEYIVVNFELIKNNSICIDLLNETGATVKQLLNIHNCKKGIYNYQLNIPLTLFSGSYFIRLKDDRNTYVKKVILKK